MVHTRPVNAVNTECGFRAQELQVYRYIEVFRKKTSKFGKQLLRD